MAVPTRADFYTGSDVLDVIYQDIALAFVKSPVTGYLGEVTNEMAVAQMMQCLILVNSGDWPFEPNNGSAVNFSLFEPNDPFSIALLTSTIQNTLTNYAPQVNVVGVQVVQPNDPDIVSILIAFQIQNIPGTFSTVLPVLRRLR